MKYNFLLAYSAVLFLASTAIVVLGAKSGLLNDTVNLCIIGSMTLLGYLGSYLAYTAYRERLKDADKS